MEPILALRGGDNKARFGSRFGENIIYVIIFDTRTPFPKPSLHLVSITTQHSPREETSLSSFTNLETETHRATEPGQRNSKNVQTQPSLWLAPGAPTN